MIVELDLYSGAPNPRWTLDDAAARALDAAVAGLQAGGVDALRPTRLGYRGLIVRTVPSTGDGLFIGGGHVFRDGRVLSDPGRRIERWLLASAIGHVDGRLLEGLL